MDENAPAEPGATEYRDMLRRLRVLVVGGGAIGQVFGRYLQAGGADVSFLLKPRYVEDAKEGWDIHHYGVAGLRPRQHLKPTNVFTDHRQLRAHTFDQIWLCVSSPAIRSGMLEQLNQSCPHAVWVSFQPGIEDREYLIKRVPANKLIIGLVNFIAYQAPLYGEEVWPAGIAYFIPPFSLTQFTGPEPYASAVANMLQKGGMRAGVRPDTAAMARFGSSVLIPLVIALECSGWSWSQLRSNAALVTLMVAVITDLQHAIEKSMGVLPGSFGMAQKPFAWKLALFAAPKVASFPLEEYFKHHFLKVRNQTDQMIDDFAQLCRDNAIVPRSLEALRDQWRARRQPLEFDNEQPAPPSPAPSNTVASVPVAADPVPVSPEPLPPPVAAAPIPVKPDDSAMEPTRPMSLDRVGRRGPQEPVPPEPERPAAIAVDFDFDGTDNGEKLELAGPGEMLIGEGDGLDEPTDQPMIDDDEIFVSDGAAAHRRELPELDVELELEPLEPLEPLPETKQPKKSAKPVLRTLADLDKIPAIEAPPEPEPEPEPEPVASKPLPFVADPEPEPIPSIIVDPELETEEQPRREAMKTIIDPPAGPVHFRDAVPEEERGDLRRQDFIQTEFANEAQNADLRNLKQRLRSRLGAKKGMSPALDDDD